MKNIINLLFISMLFSLPALAQDEPEIPAKVITCGFGQCEPNFTPGLYLEQADRTVVNLGNNNNAPVKAVLPPNQDPRDLVLSINNNSLIGQNLEVDLASKKMEKNTGNFTLIGDIFKDININMNGYSGVQGDDASVICASRFMDGTYGEDSKNFFLNRRANNPELSPTRCDGQDVQHLQESKFQCQNPEFTPSEFDTVNIYRVKYKQRCIGTSIRYKCLQRKINLKCEWATIAMGFEYSCGKGCYRYCSRTFGGSDCTYNANSCWRSDYNYQDPWYPGKSNWISSYPNGSEVPNWSISSELGRCAAHAGTHSFGGWFAYQRSSEVNEATYISARDAGQVARVCKDYPNPTRRNSVTNPAWKFSKVAEASLTYPGLDPDTQTPLPGSNWIVKMSDFFVTCDTYGEFQTMNSQIDNWTTFGEIGNNCSDARIPEDTNNLIPWSKAGEEQDPSFGTERLLCSPGNCPVQSLVTEGDLNFDTIDPSAGANGTSQGNASLLIYDYKTLSASAMPGTAGNGGQNDVADLQSNKYCVKVDDAQTQGILSPFANNPVASFNIYKWKALNVRRGQASGTTPPFSKNKINIYKKLDSSIRYLIQQETL